MAVSTRSNEEYEGELVFVCDEEGCRTELVTPDDPHMAGYALGQHGWDLYAFHGTVYCPRHSRLTPWKGETP